MNATGQIEIAVRGAVAPRSSAKLSKSSPPTRMPWKRNCQPTTVVCRPRGQESTTPYSKRGMSAIRQPFLQRDGETADHCNERRGNAAAGRERTLHGWRKRHCCRSFFPETVICPSGTIRNNPRGTFPPRPMSEGGQAAHARDAKSGTAPGGRFRAGSGMGCRQVSTSPRRRRRK